MADLHPEHAKATARTALEFVASFSGEEFGYAREMRPEPHDGRHLATALDQLEELASMVLNLADRCTSAEGNGSATQPQKKPGAEAMNRKTTPSREWLFVLTWTDRHGERRGPLRHYLRLDTAAARATQLLITSGEPGDVAELAHLGTGMQLGWVKINANGTISCWWDWTDDFSREVA